MPIITPRKREFRDPDFYANEVVHPLRAKKIPRRRMLDELMILYEHDGRFCTRAGKPFVIPDIASLFSDADPTKWFWTLQRLAPCGLKPKSYSYRTDRLQLVYLFIQVTELEAGELRLAA
ncbi:MAG: hypothetical protein ROR55_17810 [Devosia sp.]